MAKRWDTCTVCVIANQLYTDLNWVKSKSTDIPSIVYIVWKVNVVRDLSNLEMGNAKT